MNKTVWDARSVDEVEKQLYSDTAAGLDGTDAVERLAKYGPNTLIEAKQVSIFMLVLHQFKSLIVALLIAAGSVAFVMAEVVEAMAILVVIVLNAIIGFATKWKAASALAGLRKQSVAVARVLRDGEQSQIPAAQLVPGRWFCWMRATRATAYRRMAV